MLVIESKKESWEVFGQQLEDIKNGNHKLFYTVLKILRNGKSHTINRIKSKKGNLLTVDTKGDG